MRPGARRVGATAQGIALALSVCQAVAQGLSPGGPAAGAAVTRGGPAAAAAATKPALTVPRVFGRLGREQLGLVINTADPYSVAVGEYYAERRGLAMSQVLRVDLPLSPSIDESQFEALRERIAQHFGASIQALALAWNRPYAVGCNAITGALALGLDLSLCRRSCAASRPSPYFNSASTAPFSDFMMRPAMLLAAGSEEEARALIDRGVAADGIAWRRGVPTPRALYLPTTDAARNVRAPWYPAPGRSSGIEVAQAAVDELAGQSRLIVVQTGIAVVPNLSSLHWLPGALADHLTSFGGQLGDAKPGSTQTSVLDWIHSGATASHGTVSEPCNHLQKFPQPQVMLLHYLQGATAIEAYWKSVAWPQQSLFVGEPLAAPFARAGMLGIP